MNLMVKHLAKVSRLLLCLLAFPVQAQISGVDYNWEEKRDAEGIKIYTSDVAHSPFRAVRGEMKVTGTIAGLVALVDDLPNCPNWADLCKESILVKLLSPTEQYVYVYNDIPFPVKDRDVVAHVQWQRDEESGRVSMQSVATSSEQSQALRAKTKKAVRLTNAVSQWHFTPLDDGKVLVEIFAHIDPDGPTPAWITNLMLVDSPFKTMKNMREIIQSGDYADAVEKF